MDKKLRWACYFANGSMSIVGNLSPVLFITFRNLYGISYSLLGFLVLINFVTQLCIDLVFSFFSEKFNIEKTVKSMPVITIIGLLIYAFIPYSSPSNAYMGILIGTIIFSCASGLAEVLISPVISASAEEGKEESELSRLHSVYAWGVVGVIIVSTLFLFIFGNEKWYILPCLLALIPLASSVLFMFSSVPDLKTEEKNVNIKEYLKRKELWLLITAIFLGGASECTMAQWCSGYLENALHIKKVWGDILGVTGFAFMLGMGRSLYAKYGKNIEKVLFFGSLGATVCYLTASLSLNPYSGLIACIITGFCVSMMWPGSLIVASDKFVPCGVFIYAMMASGGDMGASVGPQIVGIVTDKVLKSQQFSFLSSAFSISQEQLAMKTGMLIGSVFPICAMIVFGYLLKVRKNKEEQITQK